MQVVNGGIAIWNKAARWSWRRGDSTCSGPSTTAAPGTDVSARTTTARRPVLYDRWYGRWLITQLSLPNKAQNASPSFVCMAVSHDERSDRRLLLLFDFPFAAVLDDYPQFANWADGYYASFNNFGATSLIGANVCAFDRSKMVAGQYSGAQCFLIPGPVFGLLPANLAGPLSVATPTGASAPFLNVDTATGKLNLWKLHADFTTPANKHAHRTDVDPRRRVLAHLRDHGGVRSAAEPGVRARPGVRPPDAAARLPQLRDARVADRQPQRRRRDRGRRALVRAALALRDAHGLPAGDLRAGRRQLALHGKRRPGAEAEHRARVQPVERDNNPSVAWDRAAGALFRPGRWPGGDRDRRGRGVETGTISAGVAANRWGAWSSMSPRPERRLHVSFTSELYPANGVFNWDTRIAAFKFPGCGANDFSLVASYGQDVPQGARSATRSPRP